MILPLCFALFVVGLYCVLTKRNVIKIVIGLTIMEYSVNLFLVLLGYKKQAIMSQVQASVKAPTIETSAITNWDGAAGFRILSGEPKVGPWCRPRHQMTLKCTIGNTMAPE